MIITILHSSKTQKALEPQTEDGTSPMLLESAVRINAVLLRLSVNEIENLMHLSPSLAENTYKTIHSWSTQKSTGSAAIDVFKGDIYSGLQAQSFSADDRIYAEGHLRILSALYGILKPLDLIHPYRLEMGYKLSIDEFKNLYQFWGHSIADTLDPEADIINLTSQEYAKAILPYLKNQTVISPLFLTKQAGSNDYVQVAVHSKIARGAFANWMIKQRIENVADIRDFNKLGYAFSDSLSNDATRPVYTCDNFLGIGLSIRSFG